ncbi:hypothetical protein ABIE49_001795 [Bradyrhizobium sp. OAE829]
MRLIAALVSILALSGQAIAQITTCQSTPKASDRLACYDRGTPPTGAPSHSDELRLPPRPIKPRVVDMLAAENSKLDAKLKTICRGC